MANRLYSNGREKVMDGAINLDTADLRVVLVASTYTFNVDDEFMTSIGANDNGRSATLTNTAVLGGGANSTLDADDTTLTATAAVACNALVIFIHTGVDATARLFAYVDTATGLPFTPAASQTVNVVWDNGANKIVNWTST
jgi:hypothetical protein